MALRRPSRGLAAAMLAGAVAAFIAACTGGVGDVPRYDDNYDPHRGAFEDPGDGREDPPRLSDRPRRNVEKPPRGIAPPIGFGQASGGGASNGSSSGQSGGTTVDAGSTPSGIPPTFDASFLDVGR